MILHPAYVAALLSDDGDIDGVKYSLDDQLKQYERTLTDQYSTARILRKALFLPSDNPEHMAAREMLEKLRDNQTDNGN